MCRAWPGNSAGRSRGATQALAEFILGALPDGTVPAPADAAAWLAALPGDTGLTPPAHGTLCDRFLWPLNEMLEPRAPLPSRVPLLEAAWGALSLLAVADPTDAGWQRDLWISCYRIAHVMEREHSPDARQWWGRAFVGSGPGRSRTWSIC